MKITRLTALFLSALILLLSLHGCEKSQVADDNTDISAEAEIIEEIQTENTETEYTEASEIDPVQSSEEQVQDIPEIPEVIEEPNIFALETHETFFENAAFVGDSVMYGLEIYSRRKKTIQSNATFLTISSFAARHALSDVTPNSYHPLYNGEKMKVEDALLLDGANKVFLFLGLNDVRVTPNEYFDNYVKFIDRIKETTPDISIFIISTTYPIESPHSMDRPTAASYRDQLKDLNEKLYNYSLENGAYYIDVITPLMSENGFLDNKYTSDSYVHLTNSAYEIWTQILDEYALSLINTGFPPNYEEVADDDIAESTTEVLTTENDPPSDIETEFISVESIQQEEITNETEEIQE